MIRGAEGARQHASGAAPGRPASGACGFDPARIEALRELLGHETLEPLLRELAAELRETPPRLSEAAAREDYLLVGSMAHTFKGAVINFGCTGAAEVAAKVEEAAALGLVEELTALVAHLESVARDTAAMLPV